MYPLESVMLLFCLGGGGGNFDYAHPIESFCADFLLSDVVINNLLQNPIVW